MEFRYTDAIADLKPSAIREIFKILSDPTVISFAAGNPAPETFPVKELQELAAEICGGALQYGITEGFVPLRERLKAKLRLSGEFCDGGDDLIVVSGAQQGIQLTAMIFCERGDTILCEQESFIGSLNAFRALGINPRGVETDRDGVLPDALERAIDPSVKLLYLIPNFQNPTGATMSAERRREVSEICLRRGIVILEDDPYGELYFDAPPPKSVKSLGGGNTVYVGSFSKVISPGLRLGYVSAPSGIVSKLTVAKQGVDVHSSMFSQLLADRYLERYDMSPRLDFARKLYKSRRDVMLDGLRGADLKINPPGGGLFLWCDLGRDSSKFCEKLAARKLAVVPGSAFLPDGSKVSTGFRLNFSLPSEEQIRLGCELLLSEYNSFI